MNPKVTRTVTSDAWKRLTGSTAVASEARGVLPFPSRSRRHASVSGENRAGRNQGRMAMAVSRHALGQRAAQVRPGRETHHGVSARRKATPDVKTKEDTVDLPITITVIITIPMSGTRRPAVDSEQFDN